MRGSEEEELRRVVYRIIRSIGLESVKSAAVLLGRFDNTMSQLHQTPGVGQCMRCDACACF